MDWTAIVITILNILAPVIALGLVTLVGIGIKLLRQQVEKIDNDTLRSAFLAALAEAEVEGKNAVLNTNQVLVDAIKQAAQDGKLTKEEAKEAMAHAVEYFKEHLSDMSKGILVEFKGPIDEWLESFIEAKIGEIRSPMEAKVGGLASPLS